MAIMTGASTSAESMTVHELDALPDDGRRRELVDGVLIVAPAPSVHHQRVASRLFTLLQRTVDETTGLEVFFAPLDVRTSATTSLQPDVLVAPREDFTEANLPVAPLLAVEILSPSTRHLDLGLKRSAYEALSTMSYWVVDPAEPSVIAWELRDGGYVEVGRVAGDEALELDRPVPVRIVPAELVP